MTRDDVIKHAREAEGEEKGHGWWHFHIEDLERFAAIIQDAYSSDESLTIAYMDGYHRGQDALKLKLTKAVEQMPFGKDTAQSFALFIKDFK